MSDHDYLEFRHLKYVLAIAIAGNFGTAANNLYLAQSSLSTQIQKLEEYYGIQIFVRDREGVSGLTEIGRVLVAAAEDLLKQRDDLVDLIVTLRSGSPTALRIGFTSLVEKRTLESVIDLARSVYQSCDIISDGDAIERLESKVREGELHAALVTLPLVDSEGLTTHVIERERLVVCMRNDDPLAEHEAIPAHRINGKLALFEYPLVHERAHTRLLELLAGIGVSPKPSNPTQNRDHVQWMVHERHCYALVRSGRPLMPGLTTRPIHGTDWTIDTALILNPKVQHPALLLMTREFRQSVWQPEGTLLPKKKKPSRDTAIARSQKGRPKRENLRLFDA